MKTFFSLALMALIAGCSSTPDPTEPFDKKYNSTTNERGETVGMKDDQIVIKKKVYLEERLSTLENEVNDLQRVIYGESKRFPGGTWAAVKDCRKRSADPRVGGSGTPEAQEPWEDITKTEEEFKFKADDNDNVIGYSEEQLNARITRFKKYKRILDDRYESFRKKLDGCEAEYQTALVQHGLNPNDTQAKGEWVEGPNGYKVWKMKRSATKDPEELMRRKQKTQSK